LPKRFLGYPVIDGDLSDARFLDPKSTVIGLRFKSASAREETIERAGAFVVRERALSSSGYFVKSNSNGRN
jgi:hypothetical protein